MNKQFHSVVHKSVVFILFMLDFDVCTWITMSQNFVFHYHSLSLFFWNIVLFSCSLDLSFLNHAFQQINTVKLQIRLKYSASGLILFSQIIDRFEIFSQKKKIVHSMRIFATTTISIVHYFHSHCAITYLIWFDFACIECGCCCCFSVDIIFVCRLLYTYLRWPLKSLNRKSVYIWSNFATKESNHAYFCIHFRFFFLFV